MSKKYQILQPVPSEFKHIISDEACEFLSELAERFTPQVNELLKKREQKQEEINRGILPDFLPQTKHIREGDWKIAGIPEDIQDRRVEITGPVDRKMTINGLNSGAKVYMADFEDSHTPTWLGNLDGQNNMYDAVRKNISFRSPEGKSYQLKNDHAVLMVRTRGWHLFEKQFLVNDQEIPGGLFDFGLYFFNNAKEFLKFHGGVYLYLPKMESHLEARLWNGVFVFAQDFLNIPQKSVKVTVLIETILASFEMDEILYELKDHIIGLNCGRWDYIFSFIKKFRLSDKHVLPDRSLITMQTHFMNSYSLLLINTCHKRGAFAMGGMAAFIPVRGDEKANELAMDKVREGKINEVTNGHDGTWVAHPGLVKLVTDIFDEHMKTPNQLHHINQGISITQADLLKIPKGDITENGFRNNISVGIQYLAAWLGGTGCVPINNMMEDAATVEIARSQIWQWLQHSNCQLSDGRDINEPFLKKVLQEELDKIKADVGDEAYNSGHYAKAAELFVKLSLTQTFEEFLTLSAYRMVQ